MEPRNVLLSDLDDTEFLEHYGVVGMKWGVRRFQNKDGSLTAAGRKRLKNEAADSSSAGKSNGIASVAKKIGDRIETTRQNAKARREAKKIRNKEVKEQKRIVENARKKISDMTDKELNQAIARVKLENEYKELDRQNHPGREYAKTLIKDVGRKALTDPNTYITAAKGLDYLITKKTPEIRLEETKNKNASAERKHKESQGAIAREHVLKLKELDFLTPEEQHEWALDRRKNKS